ncbi:MAG: iron-sulfur cluster biosynthesis protein [Acidimicrobiales bacterium]
MLTVTDDAASAMRTALDKAELPTAGLRISADHETRTAAANDGPEPEKPMLRLDVVTDANDADAVVEAPGGLQVFIEPEVAPLLDDKVLDGEIEPSGRSAFRILTQKQ